VNLQSGEERLLTILMRRSGRLVTKEMIDRALASESEAMSANAIEQRVSRLRRVLEVARTDIQIKTVRGSGYVLEPASRQTASQPSASFGDAI
jgi:two-component system OmpR family response regulator